MTHHLYFVVGGKTTYTKFKMKIKVKNQFKMIGR